jgi:hypothetical protein
MALETLRKRSREGSTSNGNRSATSLEGADVSRSVGSDDGLALLDADLLRCHESRATSFVRQNSSNSFQTYPASSNAAFPSHTGNYFPWGEWGMPYFNHPIVTADVGAQFLVPLVEEQPAAQAFGKVRPYQDLC